MNHFVRHLAPGATALALALAAVACGSGSEDLTPASSNAASAAVGEAKVKARKCAGCHGADLSGSKAMLGGYDEGVELYSPNLTPDPETGVGNWTDEQLIFAIREGIDNKSMVLCPQMQHYKTMSDDEVHAIVAYLRTIPAKQTAIPESVCPPLKTRE